MKKIRLYYPESYQSGNSFELTGDAFQHAVKVLRCRVGDMLELFDGEGQVVFAELTAIEKRRAEVTVGEFFSVNSESPLNTVLIQSVSKGERMDWVLQKATELGVTSIQPVISERCNVQLDKNRWLKRMQHWQRVIVSACEQCGRNQLPRLNPVIELTEFLKKNNVAQLYFLQPNSELRIKNIELDSNQPVGFLIGPEGGFSDSELEHCIAARITGVSLGPRILRTETAGVTVLALAQSLWGDV